MAGVVPAAYDRDADPRNEPLGPDPAPATVPEGGVMTGVELTANACDGHVVMALRGELDLTGAADAEAAIATLMIPGRCLIIDMSALDFIDCGSLGALLRVQERAWSTGGDVVLAAPQRHLHPAAPGPDRQGGGVLGSRQRAGRRGGPAPARGAVRWAAACGEYCTLWEGSAIACWYRVIAAGAAAARAGSLRGWMRG